METAAPKFIGKKFSERLDGNLSIAMVDSSNGVTALACVLFMADGEAELDSFHVDMESDAVHSYVADGTLFQQIEDLYLAACQWDKNQTDTVCH